MQVGELNITNPEPDAVCDTCGQPAVLVINDQPQCLADAGPKLAAEPSVLAGLVSRSSLVN